MKESPLQALIEQRRKMYNATKNTYCPLLEEIVYFNNKGFFHATHDGRDRIRPEAEARMRLNLLTCRVGKNGKRKKDVIVVLRRIGNGRLHYYSVRYAKKQNRPSGSAYLCLRFLHRRILSSDSNLRSTSTLIAYHSVNTLVNIS